MVGYRITLKSGDYFDTDAAGNIAYDSGRNYRRDPANGFWQIVGFSTRHNSQYLISLPDAAAGDNIGQGWVHDLDHGTRRMWSHPPGQRAVRVEVRP